MRAGRLVFVGFHGSADRATPESQSELLAALLADAGYDVRSGSARPRQLLRLADQLVLVARSLRWADVVVLCQFSQRRSWTTFLAARLTRRAAVPTVIVLRGGALPEFAERRPRRVDATLALASRVVAPSGYLQRAFEARGHRVATMANLVRLEVAASHRPVDVAAPKVLWMRAFSEVYQPVLALEAFALLLERFPAARLTLAGPDRGLLDETRRRATELGIADRVDLPGYLEGDGKATELARHDLFLNTTRIDNSPVSVIEAMAAGLPVVATDVGGLRDLARPGEDALLVPDGDPAALAEAMVRVVADPLLAARLRGNGAEIAARHRPAEVRRAWEHLLTELGGRLGPPPRSGVGPLARSDLDDVVRLHREAFPSSGLTALGPRVVRRYYAWQFSGPHPEPVNLGSWRDGELVGFLVGGVRHGAVAGFARTSVGTVAGGIATHPRALARFVDPKVSAVLRAMRGLGRRPPAASAAGPAPAAAPVARRSGVLSIAVAERARGTDVAGGLLDAAEARARAGGFDEVNLSVDRANGRAIAFYEKHGWRRSDTVPWDGRMAKPLRTEPA